MSAKVEDYHEAVEGLRSDLERLGNDLVSMYLYGSVARGNILPGRSDVGDAYVFLRQRVIENRESFLAALDSMVDACRNLSRTGIHSHAFHYYGAEETRYIHAAFRPVLLSEKESQRIAGVDMAGRFEEALPLESGLHDMYHFYLFPMAGFLGVAAPTVEERGSIAAWMDSFRKILPPWACAAAGAPAAGDEALGGLARLCPDVDLSPLDDLAILRDGGGEPPGSAEIKVILLRCFTMVAEIHRCIAARGPGEPPRPGP